MLTNEKLRKQNAISEPSRLISVKTAHLYFLGDVTLPMFYAINTLIATSDDYKKRIQSNICTAIVRKKKSVIENVYVYIFLNILRKAKTRVIVKRLLNRVCSNH